jgi:hypothetical protein
VDAAPRILLVGRERIRADAGSSRRRPIAGSREHRRLNRWETAW